MGFVGKRDSENLKDFIDAALQFHIVLYYCHKAVSDYGTIDLDAHGILRCTPKLLDAQVLLNPFEEQLHAPSVAVKLRDFLNWSRQVIGQENISCIVFGVDTYHFAEFFGVILRAFINWEIADGIWNHIAGKPPFPRFGLESYIGFRPDNEGRSYAVNGVEVAEVVVSTAEPLLTASLQGPGKIVVTDNGDPTSLQSFADTSRKAFNGLLLVIVKAQRGAKGKLTLSVQSPGLQSATLPIEIE